MTSDSCRKHQAGTIMLLALIVLTVLAIGALAMIRSVDGSTVTAGNIAIRQATQAAAEVAIQDAHTWLLSAESTGQLEANQAANGYFAFTPLEEVDWTAFDWTTGKSMSGPSGRNFVYVIHRLCSTVGSPNALGNHCISGEAVGKTTTESNSKSVGSKSIIGITVYYYRITVRVLGPRNSESIVQATVEI